MRTGLCIFCLAMIIMASGCAPKAILRIEKGNYLDYQPVDPPQPVSKVVVFDSATQAEREFFWESLPPNISKLNLLPVQTAQVSLSKSDDQGSISIFASSITGEAGSYEVTMDYMKYRIDPRFEDGAYLGSAQIGVGLRMKARVVTRKAHLNLAGIGALGVEASKGNLWGSISVDIIGIDSKEITTLIPLTSQIDETSIQSALQALASIKSKIWDESTTLTPHLFAYLQAKPNAGPEIIRQISEYSKTASGDCLRKFWKPDGVNKDTVNENRLIDWMGSHGLDTGPGSITMFLRGAEFEGLRVQAITDLGIDCH